MKGGIAPARDLRQATFRLEQDTGKARVSVELGATPTSATTSDLWIMWGQKNGTQCLLDDDASVDVATHLTGGGEVGSDWYWTRTGSTVKVEYEFFFGWEDFNCAAVATLPTDSETPDQDQAYDAAVAELKDVLAAPQGDLRSKLTGGSQAAYAGTWTTLAVRVRNPGTGPATGVKAKLSGKGIKTASKKVGTIAAGKSRVVKVRVKARPGKKERQLQVSLSGRGPDAISNTNSFPIEVRTQGQNPKAGSYVGNNGRVSFRVTGSGVVKKIRLRVVGICNPGAYTWADWQTVPKAKINRYRWLDRTYHRGKGVTSSTAWLTARFNRGRVLEGRYVYWSGLCDAEVKFKARRVGP